jgi:uncharacterized membrane protein
MILLAILFPPIVFFLIGRPIAGFISLLLYILALAFAFLIPPLGIVIEIALIIWAIVARINAKTKKRLKEMENKIMASQVSAKEQ